jgi:hypothetical protein
MKDLNSLPPDTALRVYERIMAVTTEKLQYLPEEHKAEIWAVYVEEGLMDLDEAGHSCQTILARRMVEKFYDIPIAVTVFEGKTYGAYIGNWAPYELPAYAPMIAMLAISMGLFKDQTPGEIAGKPVVWWRNKRA